MTANKDMAKKLLDAVVLGMNKSRLINSWLQFLVLQGYTHAVTFKPNEPRCLASIDSLHRLFVKIHMLVDRRILGSRFATPARAHLRSHAIGIVEGLPNSGHLHGAFRVAPDNWSKFEALFADGTTEATRTGIWRRLLPHGSAVVEPIYEASGWHAYAFKNVWQCNDTDRVVFLPLPVVSPVPSI
jgi:hypothetical protein